MSILIVVLILYIVKAKHNIFDVNSKCTRRGRSNIYKCSEFNSGIYDVISENVSAGLHLNDFKTISSSMLIKI